MTSIEKYCIWVLERDMSFLSDVSKDLFRSKESNKQMIDFNIEW